MVGTAVSEWEWRVRRKSALSLRALAVATAIIAVVMIIDGCLSTANSTDKLSVAGPLTLLTGIGLLRPVWRYWQNSGLELRRLKMEAASTSPPPLDSSVSPTSSEVRHEVIEPPLNSRPDSGQSISVKAKIPIVTSLLFGLVFIGVLGYQAYNSPGYGQTAPIGLLLWLELLVIWVWSNPVILSVDHGVLTIKPSVGPLIRGSNVTDLALHGTTLGIRFADLDAVPLATPRIREVFTARAAKTGYHFEVAGGVFKKDDVNRLRAAVGLPVQPSHSNADFEQRLRDITSRPTVTYGLIALNVGVFISMVLSGVDLWQPSVEQLIAWGANFAALTTSGQWWRTITSVFIHIGLLHLFCNMYVLKDVGPTVERLVGSKLFLIGYLFCGFCGSVASVVWNPSTVSAGASGAIFGLFGIGIGLLIKHRGTIPSAIQRQHKSSLIVFVGYNLYLSLFLKGVDIAAHMGGLAAGFCFGFLIVPVFTARNAGIGGQRIIPTAAICVVIGALLLQSVPQVADLPAAGEQVNRRELEALASLKSILQDLEDRTITNHDAATRVREQVMLPFQKELDHFQSIPNVATGQRDGFELIIKLMQSRLKAWNAFADFLDSNDLAKLGEYELNEEARIELNREWVEKNRPDLEPDSEFAQPPRFATEVAVFAALTKRFEEQVHFEAKSADSSKMLEDAERIEKALPELQAAVQRFKERGTKAEGRNTAGVELVNRYAAALEERWKTQIELLRNPDDKLAIDLQKKVVECEQLEQAVKWIVPGVSPATE